MRKTDNIALFGGKKDNNSHLYSLLLKRGYEVFTSNKLSVNENLLDKLAKKLQSACDEK
jgi:hypothetical protein